jgi:hypothetical protein
MDEATAPLFAYRTIIPFKNFKQIAQQIDWAGANYYREGHYNLANRNCEHLANMLVYGINFSKQVEERPTETALLSNCSVSEVNNEKTTVNLANEISQTNSQLGQSTGSVAQRVEARIQIPLKDN